MRRDLDARLARIKKAKAAAAMPRDLAEVRHRWVLRARCAIGALLRERLGRLHSGPATAAALRLGDAAAVELTGIPDTPELRRTDEALLACDDDAAAPDEFEAKILRSVQQYRAGHELDPALASPAELLACSVARPAKPEK